MYVFLALSIGSICMYLQSSKHPAELDANGSKEEPNLKTQDNLQYKHDDGASEGGDFKAPEAKLDGFTIDKDLVARIVNSEEDIDDKTEVFRSVSDFSKDFCNAELLRKAVAANIEKLGMHKDAKKISGTTAECLKKLNNLLGNSLMKPFLVGFLNGDEDLKKLVPTLLTTEEKAKLGIA